MCKVRFDMTAVIYDKKGRILSIGKNSYIKTHTVMAKMANKVGLPDKVFLHAEVDAILKCRDLSKAHRIFVSRFYKNDNPAPAKPCPICVEAIRELTDIEVIEHT